jgi:hypothetical protein
MEGAAASPRPNRPMSRHRLAPPGPVLSFDPPLHGLHPGGSLGAQIQKVNFERIPYASLPNRPAQFRASVRTCIWGAPVEEFFSILVGG